MYRTTKIETPRLKLVPFTADMVHERYVGWLNDPEIVRYSEQRHRRHTRESCMSYVNGFDHKTTHIWAIFAGDTHVGNVSAHRDVPNRTADVGIIIGNRQSQGMGFGSEAWRAICGWLLDGDVRKVTAGTMAENIPMIRVFAKTGMIEEGRCRGQFLLDDRPVDLILTARFR